jgi:hypothetical protein
VGCVGYDPADKAMVSIDEEHASRNGFRTCLEVIVHDAISGIDCSIAVSQIQSIHSYFGHQTNGQKGLSILTNATQLQYL